MKTKKDLREKVTIRLPGSLITKIDLLAHNRSRWIEKAVTYYLKRGKE